MGRFAGWWLGLVLAVVAVPAEAKADRVRQNSLVLPDAAPVSVEVRIPQDEVLVEGNEVDADVYGGGLFGVAFARDKQQMRKRQTTPAAEALVAATHGVDFASAVAAQLRPALADGYFTQLEGVQAFSGDAAVLPDGSTPAQGKLQLVYRYGMTSDFKYLRIIQWATLPGETAGTARYHNFFVYFVRLPEAIEIKNSKDRSQVWTAIGPERFRGMVAAGVSTLAKAFVHDLKATGAVPKGKKMIYHGLVPGMLEEARTEAVVDGFDLGRHKDGSVVVMPQDCMQHKCWSIFDNN